MNGFGRQQDGVMEVSGFQDGKDPLKRTGLDLGRVCGVRRGFHPEVCCVVLYQSLLVASSGVAVEGVGFYSASFFSMEDINLVDPASSHTLVSKIKPCMSKYKHFCTVKLRMAHYISYSLLDSTLLLGYP
ncbi:hypothetical protein P3T76_014727 [Phytophthora citrophthora]|uniref:Uncharacterized protein n=1 Tax=Phytophthora citrophthora TaxID=4793 RepID=A0AAD9FZU1_9STRA|nr:hypothetical protein P3T76_015597 [Phytophthora citrophthora]KAK1928962.1 hypothetical protein P3T76_015602 [Phytophthora citrophthora]KAK1928966.1 hypothetical protein P3T76_015606 [Phytophthora citrophthora]KAK1928969.1 hypothetical protein P3T76_015609 [Phytophthora citrophthora]KAK1929881.1 hypothetical protein P3T76_014727 [Phytophthora citrophthora]